MRLVRRFVVLCGCLVMAGCASHPVHIEKPLVVPEVYGVEHLEGQSSPVRPIWVDQIGEFRREHAQRPPRFQYFVGVATPQATYADGRKVAKDAALSEAAEGVKTTVRSLFKSTLSEADQESYGLAGASLRQEIVETISTSAKRVLVGAVVDGYYWRKYWIQDDKDSPRRETWHVYALVSIPEALYKKDVYLALQKQEEAVAGDPLAKEKIQAIEKVWAAKNPVAAGVGNTPQIFWVPGNPTPGPSPVPGGYPGIAPAYGGAQPGGRAPARRAHLPRRRRYRPGFN